MKSIVAVFIALAVVTLSVPSFADPIETFKGGLRDVIRSPLQISDNMKEESTGAKFLPFALVGGFLKGTFYMAKQAVTGTVVIVTSPFDGMHKK